MNAIPLIRAGQIKPFSDFLNRVGVPPEREFLSAVANLADCRILLDINNIYVSAFNHEFDPCEYLANVPVEHVWQTSSRGAQH